MKTLGNKFAHLSKKSIFLLLLSSLASGGLVSCKKDKLPVAASPTVTIDNQEQANSTEQPTETEDAKKLEQSTQIPDQSVANYKEVQIEQVDANALETEKNSFKDLETKNKIFFLIID